MRRVATSWKVIESVLEENAHSVFKALRPPARLADVRKLENLVGTKLPQTLVASLRIHDGMQDTVEFFDFIRLLPAARMAEWWRVSRENPWEGYTGPQYNHGRRIKGALRWREGWVPIASDAGGNLLGIDLDPGPAGTRSQVFAWHNYGSPPPRVLADSYAAWLDAVAEEMFHRRFTLNEWGGIDLRKRLS
jgi:cell wall assembly regulator SMI1